MPDTQHREILRRIARRAMFERGLAPDFSDEALACAQNARPVTNHTGNDLRDLLWSSIDDDDSCDLDQLTAAQELDLDRIRVYVAIADVENYVPRDGALDEHARKNTTSVYTAAQVFPMLPERLSCDLSSLAAHQDRLALVFRMTVTPEGAVEDPDVSTALVVSRAKLAYNSLARWLEGAGPVPGRVEAVPGLRENLLLQDRAARRLKTLRHNRGALDFDLVKTHPVFEQDRIMSLEPESSNRARDLIADFMIAANGVAARFLTDRGLPSFRRVVRTPRRWERMVEIAAEHRFNLPPEPDPIALNDFLTQARKSDPAHYPDLSLSIVKLMGPGEYFIQKPADQAIGHFGLAMRDYSHSTAPNRRFPDLVMQRLIKAALAGTDSPYSVDVLENLARHCTAAEDAAKKVERQVEKSAAALLLESRIGQTFSAFVTGAAAKGTWVRVADPPVEGRLVEGFDGVDVGRRLRVRLLRTDVERGFIDFARAD
jgi:VacB/RNase II family 3'-5' exoribonuclease